MKYIIALLISMIPLVELRGAVPVAIASGIPWWQALILLCHWEHDSSPNYLFLRPPCSRMGGRQTSNWWLLYLVS